MSDTDTHQSVGAIGPGSHRQSTGAAELLDLLQRPDWQANASCREHDLDLFFPGQGADATTPKRICAGCPVRPECEQYAEEHDERRKRHGIWGGRTASQREEGRPFVAPPPIVGADPPAAPPAPTPVVVEDAPRAQGVSHETPATRLKRKRPPRHGTVKRYRRGCRCERCAAASAAWWAAYRRRRNVA